MKLLRYVVDKLQNKKCSAFQTYLTTFASNNLEKPVPMIIFIFYRNLLAHYYYMPHYLSFNNSITIQICYHTQSKFLTNILYVTLFITLLVQGLLHYWYSFTSSFLPFIPQSCSTLNWFHSFFFSLSYHVPQPTFFSHF